MKTTILIVFVLDSKGVRVVEVNAIKKKCINVKVKTTSLTILLTTVFLIAALSGMQLIKEASAISYTQYTGTLDGADWALQIPDPWNDMLVMMCHGYNPNIVNPLGPLTAPPIPDILNQGFAVAASNFGVAGFCIAEGVNSTYQLTMHIIDNYNVSGRVFLVGMSMGGGIALLLGEKYPEIYSGVLDLFGTKDLKEEYTRRSNWASLTDEELSDELLALGIPVPPPGFTDLASYRPWLDVSAYELETGGTPATVPQAYEDRSPTYHANIEIPVITIHGTGDPVVLLVDSVMYQDAVAAAGSSSLYRLYTVADAGHGVNITADERINRFNELVEWSNYLIPEGFGIEVVLLLSVSAALVGFSLSRKRPKLKKHLLSNP